ncbi:hypothetical protein Hypma_014237 [Hypsizygus marmoreus]|uniref:F-box domain-containing protein n=1 Tax=Hypsizygus marmoreus TaxID=39966 RepID=A0A369JAJ2_HYPMA|nr:hypothetical protein Hypma_014237 [Hypsizygus marmoreus]
MSVTAVRGHLGIIHTQHISMEGDSIGTSIIPIPLPPEIIDTIIDQLYDEARSLKQCSLVSKVFITRAQKHLFRTIKFQLPYRRLPLKYLLKVFDNNPSLTHHVEHLHVTNYFYSKQYTQRDEILPRICRHLCSGSLKSVFFQCARGMVHANSISFDLATALIQMFQSNKLIDITLDYCVNFPVIYLASTCAYLKRLSLISLDSYQGFPLEIPPAYDDHLATSGALALPISSSTSRLEFLKIDYVAALAMQKLYERVSHPPSTFTFSHLRSIELHGHKTSMQEVAAAIIVDAASTLEEFDWDHNSSDPGPEFEDGCPIALGVTTNLRILKFACMHPAETEPFHLLWVAQSLVAIKGHNHLEEIILVLYCHPQDIIEFGWRNSADWASSFDVLLASGDFEFLRRVEISIDFFDYGDEDDVTRDDCDRAHKCLEDRLPLLRGMGVLSISWIR